MPQVVHAYPRAPGSARGGPSYRASAASGRVTMAVFPATASAQIVEQSPDPLVLSA